MSNVLSGIRNVGVLGKIVLATAIGVPLAGCSPEKKEEQEKKIEQVIPNNPHSSAGDTEEKKKEFEKLLSTNGVTGLVHGSIPRADMYVFVYGDPIQGGEHFSLIPQNDEIRSKLEKITRHQAVTINGKLLKKGTPQQHILVEAINPGTVWNPKVPFKYTKEPYFTPEELKKELEEKKEINCVVHAVLHDGKVLIINYQGGVIPVHVNDPKWTKDLRSSDKIKLRYKVRDHEHGPPHISLRIENNIPPVQVIDAILPLSDSKEKYKLEGSLVWFPKSPILTREVWGLRVVDSNGLVRTFSLHNLRDKQDVQKIDAIFQKAWQKKNNGFIRSSSFFYHPSIKVEVTGDIIHFVPNQRNPLIDLDSKDIKLLP